MPKGREDAEKKYTSRGGRGEGWKHDVLDSLVDRYRMREGRWGSIEIGAVGRGLGMRDPGGHDFYASKMRSAGIIRRPICRPLMTVSFLRCHLGATFSQPIQQIDQQNIHTMISSSCPCMVRYVY